MSKSSGLRLVDLHALYQLVGECRELGDDAGQWRHHLAARLGAWTGAGVASVFEIDGGGVHWSGYTHWGWESSGMDRAAWDRLAAEFKTRGPAFNPMLVRYLAALSKEDGIALTYRDLTRDFEYQRTEYYQDYHLLTGADAQLTCVRSIPGRAGACCFTLVRPVGQSDFSPRHRSLVREANALIAPLVGGLLASHDEPAPGDLPPRTRQVLRCLLEGDGDKQVAVRLGITAQTVNAYTKTIYQHFGVRSRAELLARWVRRSWGSRCAWVE